MSEPLSEDFEEIWGVFKRPDEPEFYIFFSRFLGKLSFQGLGDGIFVGINQAIAIAVEVIAFLLADVINITLISTYSF